MKLLTDSPVVAQTYADLMQKRNAVNTDQNAPTVSSLTSVAAKYFKRCGKKSALGDNALLEVGETADLELMLKRAIPELSVHNAALGYTVTASAIQPGHLIVNLS